MKPGDQDIDLDMRRKFRYPYEAWGRGGYSDASHATGRTGQNAAIASGSRPLMSAPDSKPDRAAEARRFVRTHPHGVLSTLSRRLGGAPFGSIAPFVLDHEGCPVILISTLAEHTRNLDADPRCSVIAHPCAQDPQAAGRVTLVGRAERLPDKHALGPRYLRRFPEAEEYFGMHDFHFYRLRVEAVRFIGGFGSIHWIDAADFAPPANTLGDSEESILEHMNTDHEANLRAYCLHGHGLRPRGVRMIGVDVDGFDLRADEQVLRFDFGSAACDAAAVREELVALARASREPG